MNNRNLLITGASGFLGKSVLEKFSNSNEKIYSIGRKEIAVAHQHHYWDSLAEPPIIEDVAYQKIIHIAGKAHMVPQSQAEADAFFEVNVKGTMKLLQQLERLTTKPQQFIFISSVAVYGLDKGMDISEEMNPNPMTPYGKSKLEAEHQIIIWCKKYNCSYLILRLPLIAGIDPPGNLGNMKKAIARGRYPRIKNNPARKSIVLAKDVANLIAATGQTSGIYNLTDGVHPTFIQVEEAIEKRTGRKIKIILPLPLIKVMALFGDLGKKILRRDLPISSEKLNKLISSLTFDDSKARKELKWNPTPVLPFIEKYI